MSKGWLPRIVQANTNGPSLAMLRKPASPPALDARSAAPVSTTRNCRVPHRTQHRSEVGALLRSYHQRAWKVLQADSCAGALFLGYDGRSDPVRRSSRWVIEGDDGRGCGFVPPPAQRTATTHAFCMRAQ